MSGLSARNVCQIAVGETADVWSADAALVAEARGRFYQAHRNDVGVDGDILSNEVSDRELTLARKGTSSCKAGNFFEFVQSFGLEVDTESETASCLPTTVNSESDAEDSDDVEAKDEHFEPNGESLVCECDPSLPSIGSALHASGRCTPCGWFWKAQGCRNGQSCSHCHLCPCGELKSRRAARVSELKASGQRRRRTHTRTKVTVEGLDCVTQLAVTPTTASLAQSRNPLRVNEFASNVSLASPTTSKNPQCLNEVAPDGSPAPVAHLRNPQLLNEGASAVSPASVAYSRNPLCLNEVASEVLPASLANLRNPLRLNEVASDVLPASLSKLRNPVRLNEVASREFSPMLVISGSPQQLAQCIRPPPGLSLPSALMTYVEPLTVSPSQSCVPQAEDTGKTESRGAALHSSGQCKPCRWYWKSEGCRHGEECNHCHLCGPGELAARRMAKTAALRLNPLGPMDASAASRKLQLSRLV